MKVTKLRIISSSASAKRRDRDASPGAGMLCCLLISHASTQAHLVEVGSLLIDVDCGLSFTLIRSLGRFPERLGWLADQQRHLF